MALQVSEAQTLRQSLAEKGYEADLRVGDADDPTPALLEVRDGHGNRVDLLVGLRGMDPELLNRTPVSHDAMESPLADNTDCGNFRYGLRAAVDRSAARSGSGNPV